MLSIWQGHVTLQTFADHEAARGHPEIIHGTLTELEQWAWYRNANGFGIYVTVNGTDGKGRKVENIIELRTFYTDIDGLPTEEQKNAKVYDLLVSPLPPSAIVKTRNGLHCYWYAKPGQTVEPDAFKAIVKGIAHYFGGDERVSDISRVLRLPGYQHLKDPSDPYTVEVIWEDAGVLYDQGELQSAYPLPKPSTVRPMPQAVQDYIRSVNDTRDDWERIVEALAEWQPVDKEKHTVLLHTLGVALKFGIPESRAVADLIPIVATWPTRQDATEAVRVRAHWAYHSGKPTTVAGLRSLGVRVSKLSRPEGT